MTSGLDPIGSENFIRVIGRLHADLGFTMVLVTHDLLALPALCDRIAVLADGRLAVVGTLEDVMACDHPTTSKSRSLPHLPKWADGGHRPPKSWRTSRSC